MLNCIYDSVKSCNNLKTLGLNLSDNSLGFNLPQN